jgi:hypothetical protein
MFSKSNAMESPTPGIRLRSAIEFCLVDVEDWRDGIDIFVNLGLDKPTYLSYITVASIRK